MKLLFEFFLVSLKSAKEREKEEFTHQKYLKNLEKNTNPFVLKRLPYELLQFLAVVGAKLKQKIEEEKKIRQTIIKIKLKHMAPKSLRRFGYPLKG